MGGIDLGMCSYRGLTVMLLWSGNFHFSSTRGIEVPIALIQDVSSEYYLLAISGNWSNLQFLTPLVSEKLN